MESLIQKLEGPIVVLGGTGFIGSNLVKKLLAVRADVYYGGRGDALALIEQNKPKTVFNCCGCGNNGPSSSSEEIFEANVGLVINALETAFKNGCNTFIHAGSAAEYGDALLCPLEDQVRAEARVRSCGQKLRGDKRLEGRKGDRVGCRVFPGRRGPKPYTNFPDKPELLA